jgi:vacuolar-type H+-ATPase subunit H
MSEKRNVSEAFEQATRELEAAVKRAVEYIETNIVPKARRDGEKVLRQLSEELSRWADRLHDEAQNK